MARHALVLPIVLILLGVAWTAANDPPVDPDPYEVAASLSKAVVTRQLLEPQEATLTEGTNGQLQGRRRRLGARRRLLDPERRRQLMLRRRRLGLPLRRRPRPRALPVQDRDSPFLTTPTTSTLTATPTTTTTTPTQAPPLTSTSTSTSSSFSYSSSSVSSSSSSSTTLRSVFPSFSAASRLRAGAARGPGWGDKTPSEETHKEEEEKEEEEEEKGEETTEELLEVKDLGEIISEGDLKQRRRGVSKVPERPVHRRLMPTLVTTSAPPRRDRDERLRFRSLLLGKRLRDERRRATPRSSSSPSESSSTTPTAITPTTTTTTNTVAPTYSLPSPPTPSTDTTLPHPDPRPLLQHPDSADVWQDSSPHPAASNIPRPVPESSAFGLDSLVRLPDSPPHVFQSDSPTFYYDSLPLDFDSSIYSPALPPVSPESSVFDRGLIPPSHPVFLPVSRLASLQNKPRHTPVPKKVTIAPQPKWPLNPKFRPIRRFRPEIQEAKAIVPQPTYVPLDSLPIPSSPSPETHQRDYAADWDFDGFSTHKTRHFDPIPSYLTRQESYEPAEQSHTDAFPDPVAKQGGLEPPKDSHFNPFPRLVAEGDSPSHAEPDHFDAFSSFADQVIPEPSSATRGRNYVPEETDFLHVRPSYEPGRDVLQAAFSTTPRNYIRDSPARTTTEQAVEGQAGPFHTLRHPSSHPDVLSRDTEIVYPPHSDFKDSSDPLYHAEVIYTADQRDSNNDKPDGPAYKDDEVRLEGDYKDEYEDEEEPGVLDHYKYGYQVESKDTGNFQQRYEARDGATVSGSYKVALPDGRVQLVTYVADDGGFRAEVSYEGEEQSPATPAPASTPPSPPPSTPPSPPPSTTEHLHKPVSMSTTPFPSSSSSRRPPAPPHSRRRRPPQRHIARKNLRFSEHVTTVSPNPFRLVVEGGRASTLAPRTPPTAPHPTPTNAQITTPSAPRDAQAALPSVAFREYAPVTTNAHTIAPPHSLPHGPASVSAAAATTTTTTVAPPATPTPIPRYEYNSLHTRTTLYAPTTDATAYIHALGKSHAVPVLLPLHPRTYLINHSHYRKGDSVEIQRGDASRPRISIHTPSPHETDIYPSPRRPLYRLA